MHEKWAYFMPELVVRPQKIKVFGRPGGGVDRMCFCVYLVHPVFTNGFYKFLGIYPAKYGMYQLMTFVEWFLFVILAFFASWIIRIIKPLRKIL